MAYVCQNAILLLFFNRLDTTLTTLEQIAKARPKKLYLAADGGRNTIEKRQIATIRASVLEHITWEC